MPVFDNVFYEITAQLLFAAVAGGIALMLRQPLIVAFIVVGPAGLGWVTARDQVDLLAMLGIAPLLVVAGRKLGLQIIATIRPGAQAGWLGQVFFTTIIGCHVAIALAMATWQEQFA
ncbi:MAG: hypothetical protein ACYC1T_14315 [Sulfuricaulis sp.]